MTDVAGVNGSLDAIAMGTISWSDACSFDPAVAVAQVYQTGIIIFSDRVGGLQVREQPILTGIIVAVEQGNGKKKLKHARRLV